jgi:hypothetical protein
VLNSRFEDNRYFPDPARIENLFVDDGEVVLANAYEADKDKPFCVGVPEVSEYRYYKYNFELKRLFLLKLKILIVFYRPILT